VILKRKVLLGLGSFVILALSAGCDSGVRVAGERSIGSSGNVNITTADGGVGAKTETVSAGTAAQTTDGSTAGPVPADVNPSEVNIASLVGFFVTESETDVKDYAGITADGLLTDYSYDDDGQCYNPSSTQITDKGSGLFWVRDGDVVTELRLALQNGNLVLFRNEINESGRVVYPGTTAVSRADLQLCA